MNVADSVRRRRLPRVVAWSLALSSGVVVAAVLITAAAGLVRRRSEAALLAPATAPVVVERQSTEASLTAAPEKERVGARVPTAFVGEATTAAARLAPSPTSGGPATDVAATASAAAVASADAQTGASGPSLADADDAAPTATALAAKIAAAVLADDARGFGEGYGSLLTPRPRSGGPTWRAEQLTRRPRIDATLGEWIGEPEEIRAVVFGEEFWDGPEDLSARAYLGWDRHALYVGVRVVDDVFSQRGTGSELYLGDSLELQLDTLLEPDRDDDTYSRDDWQIGLSPGDFDTLEPEIYVWRPVGIELTGTEIASQRFDDGYIVEAAIPWTAIEMDPSLVGAVGLAVNVSDNDVEAPAQLTMISSSPERSWADPRTFGTLVLVR